MSTPNHMARAGRPAVSYVIVTPVRNEEQFLPKTIESVAAQTLKPLKWVIVDDGSTDGTAGIADLAAQRHPWIQVVHRADRGYRKQGGGVIEAFYDGFKFAEREPWDFLVKLDGDLSFPASYFENCFARFAADSKLGVGGGRIYTRRNGTEVEDSPGDPLFHVRGATKIYRRETWEAIGGLARMTGWDTLDEVKANMLGWKTYSLRDLRLLQLKETGSADGSWKNWVKNGRANYIAGYHPVFMLLKCSRRLAQRPYVLAGAGLMAGYLGGYLCRLPQVDDQDLIRYLRRQQMNRLLGKQSLWSASHTLTSFQSSDTPSLHSTNG